MKLSIVTPSFKQLHWLKLCAASVADQEHLEVEHIVQDAGMEDEVKQWAKNHRNLKLFSEKDNGMYDAINKALRRCEGEILAHLNCDEQYLPGALLKVADYFEKHPEIDIVFGDVIVVDRNCDYVCTRKVLIPTINHTQFVTLGTFTAATFFRKSALQKYDLYFPSDWRCLGDCVWMLNALRAGVKMALLGELTSSFMDDGQNLGLSDLSKQETVRLRSSGSEWMRAFAPYWKFQHRLRRLLGGCYHLSPFTYKVYTPISEGKRVCFEVKSPTWRWQTRLDLSDF